jgi:FkbM family methyltransferase
MINLNGWWIPDNDTVISKYAKKFPDVTYQQESIDIAYSKIKNFNIAIDVGGNVGYHSVRFAKLFNQVYTFEPVSANFLCLEKNCETFKNVKLYKLGLGDQQSSMEISLPKNNLNCGAYSFVDFKNSEELLIKETVNVMTLDSYNFTPSLIKIDTQGYELNVLKGSEQTLKIHKPVIIAECENKKLFNGVNGYLESLGYQLAGSNRKDKIWYAN